MDLILWRHAEAEEATPKLKDAKRRLTARGEKHACQMAFWLQDHIPEKLRILVSPADRAQMTAHALGLPFEVERKVGIGADVADVIAATEWPNHDGTVLVVGHQPVLGRVAALLLSGKEADWTVKKGGLWWFSNRSRKDENRHPVLRAMIEPSFVKGYGGAPEFPQNLGFSRRQSLPLAQTQDIHLDVTGV